ncbi:MAG: hypothetical protein JST68_12560 [Bacteroidetes bacterium]|nr:hypothetical protein [Bacteroidota bacterium]
MKKVTLHLLLIALIGTGAAWVNKSPNTGKGKFVAHRYSYKSKSLDGTKYYWTYDITSLGWMEGTNYDCLTPNSATCTFAADPSDNMVDANGNYFLLTDILSTSFESGTFTLD